MGKHSGCEALVSIRSDTVAVLLWCLGRIAGPSPGWAQETPWEIGHRSITFVDPSRDERAILTEIYYPADAAGNNVPVAQPEDGGFPVAVFGHGYLMSWSAYANIWQAMTPRGYVIALPRTESGLVPDHAELALDLAFLVSRLRLEAMTPASPFYGALDSSSAVMGHSMGGGAAVLAAASDASITALANLAAAETDPSAISAAAGVLVPCLVVSGSYDGVAPPGQHQIPLYQALASPCKTFVSITGGSHCQFAESNFYCELGEVGAPDPLIDRDTQHALTEAFVLPWLDFHLKGEDASWWEFEDSLATCGAITYQHDCDGIPPAPPVVTEIVRVAPTVAITWRPSPFAITYKIFSSEGAHDPISSWGIEGTTADTIWTGESGSPQRFFRVTALKE
ncbi:MAG: hypothetical protein MUE60_13065 [Candidatus Eisenbacteria bacterium]|nr:hypothetical protein [Candidatus Eisenbacteria bacterium]